MEKSKVFGVATTIDEALEKTYFGKFNYLVILFAGLVINNVVLETVGISFALPVLECDLSLTYQQRGILGAVAFIGVITSSHFWGFLADTTGRKRIMQPALLLGYMVTIASSFSPDFKTLAVLRFLNGILLSAGSATTFAYLGEFHSQKYRARAILCAALITASLSIFFPIIAWATINQDWQFYVPYLDVIFKPWRSYLLVCGMSGFLCGLSLFYLPESPKYLVGMGRMDEALTVLQRMHHTNTKGRANLQNSTFDVIALLPEKDTSTEKPVASVSASGNRVSALCRLVWQQTAPLFMREHIRKTLLASFIQFVTFFTAHGVYMWFPYILNSAMRYTQRHSEPMRLCDMIKFTQSDNFTLADDAEETTCSMHLEISTYHHTIVLEFIYVSFLLTIMWAVKRFERNVVLFTILLCSGVTGILALLVNSPLVAIYLFVVNLCTGLGTTILNAIVVDIYPTNLRAMAVCISLMIGRIGSVAGSNALGALIATNCELALYTPAGGLIVAGFLSFLLPKPSVPEKQIA